MFEIHSEQHKTIQPIDKEKDKKVCLNKLLPSIGRRTPEVSVSAPKTPS